MKLPTPVTFDWNKGNVDKNWSKHKVHFKEAEEVFFNRPIKFLIDKKHSQQENRLIALGMTNNKRLLLVVFTIRNDRVRIISARNQSKKERILYEK